MYLFIRQYHIGIYNLNKINYIYASSINILISNRQDIRNRILR